jgi:hypothetical protein
MRKTSSNAQGRIVAAINIAMRRHDPISGVVWQAEKTIGAVTAPRSRSVI